MFEKMQTTKSKYSFFIINTILKAFKLNHVRTANSQQQQQEKSFELSTSQTITSLAFCSRNFNQITESLPALFFILSHFLKRIKMTKTKKQQNLEFSQSYISDRYMTESLFV